MMLMRMGSLFAALALVACTGNEKGEVETNAAKSDQGKSKSEHYQEHYESGQLKMEGKLVEDERQGLWKSYYKDGKMWSQTHYRNDQPHGNTKTWYKNGFMRYSGQFSYGKRSGQWDFFDKEGNLVKRIDMDTTNIEKPMIKSERK